MCELNGDVEFYIFHHIHTLHRHTQETREVWGGGKHRWQDKNLFKCTVETHRRIEMIWLRVQVHNFTVTGQI